MTKLLLRLFVKNHQSPKDPKVRSSIGLLSSIVGILCNVLLAVGKLIAGSLTASVSITADAMNNLTDASSAIVTLIGFKLAEKPADENHPYGHARFEYLSGLTVSGIIVIIGFDLAKTSFGSILNPQPVAFSTAALIILVVSMVVKLWLSIFNTKLGKHAGSTALAATAADSRNDVIATGAVLLAAVIERITSWHVDGYIGLAVALFILYSGATLAIETIHPLLGEATDPELRQMIVDEIQENPYVLGYHDLMVHDYGPNQRFASIHVEMDQHVDPLLCHTVIDNLERECLASHGIHLVIHYDPIVTDDPELIRMQQLVSGCLQSIDPALHIHDFRMAKSTGHINLIFDVTLPNTLSHRKKEIQTQLEAEINRREPKKYYTVITFDPMAFNQTDNA